MDGELEARGLAQYQTKQRAKLLSFLTAHTDEQLTARQIADALTAEGISVSAVYRNLSALEKEGAIRRSGWENAREVSYRYLAPGSCREQLHLTCRVCGRSIHLGAEETERLIADTLLSTGFQIDKAGSVLYGVCAACRERGR